MSTVRHLSQLTSLLLVTVIVGCDGNPANGDAQDGLAANSDIVLPDEAPGCDGALLFERPADPSITGPWGVGMETVQIGRLTVEILYPASPGSDAGVATEEVDIRYALPESQQHLVTDQARPHQRCERCSRGLPVDQERGPYPLILFAHGTASWRTQSLSLMEHWASRGYVVAAADHPGLFLADMLGSICGEGTSGSQDVGSDLESVLSAFVQSDPSLTFIAPWVDTDLVAVLGHSAGASAAASAVNLGGVRLMGSLAGNRSPAASDDLQSSLFLGGMADTVVRFSQTEDAYGATSGDKYLLGIAEAGHLVFSDICQLTNNAGQDLIEIATEAGVCGTQFASFLFDCEASSIPPESANQLVKAATTWALEKDLHCQAPSDYFGEFGDVSTWIEVLDTSP
ncbi:MAG TPA: hypothetical protein DIU15_04810 [Deltaproteobacteria bacterium]|nr:hypothetical protein [Deltaproteobacteria bacterium]HCP45336.1 hypothetical protein [Deltaproteobacteria bacterium]